MYCRSEVLQRSLSKPEDSDRNEVIRCHWLFNRQYPFRAGNDDVSTGPNRGVPSVRASVGCQNEDAVLQTSFPRCTHLGYSLGHHLVGEIS